MFSAIACAPQCQRPALKSNMPPKWSLKGLREPISELRKLPESRFRSSESSPKRSRTAPGCTPAHRCAPGLPETRLKSLRSEPGHGFPPLLGHLCPPPSLPAQVPYTVEDPLSLHPFASTAPHASPGSADTRWPAATAADPEKKSWPSTSINFAGSEACRALRRAQVGRK